MFKIKCQENQPQVIAKCNTNEHKGKTGYKLSFYSNFYGSSFLQVQKTFQFFYC